MKTAHQVTEFEPDYGDGLPVSVKSSMEKLLGSILDAMPSAMAIVSRDGQLLLRNLASLQHINGSGVLECDRNSLLPQFEEPTRWLRTLRDMRPGRTVYVDLASGNAGLETLALSGIMYAHSGPEESVVMITFSGRAIASNDALAHWCAQSGLTPSEARVIGNLARGHDVRTAARALRITEHTARTHVRRILEKAELNSMREVLHQIALLPRVHDDRTLSAELFEYSSHKHRIVSDKGSSSEPVALER